MGLKRSPQSPVPGNAANAVSEKAVVALSWQLCGCQEVLHICIAAAPITEYSRPCQTCHCANNGDTLKNDEICDGCAYLFYLQLLLRENGLTDLYLTRTASTMLGAQALVLSAMQASNPGAGSSPAVQQGPQPCGQQQQGQKGGRPSAARLGDKRSKLKRAISSRMQRQVSEDGSGDV